MYYFFQHFPVFTISMSAALVTGGLLLLIRKLVHIRHLKGHHEVGFPIFLQMGVIYGVLLAFIFSVVWDDFSSAAKEVELESNNMKTLIQLAPGLSPQMDKAVQENLTRYAERVIDYEWPAMKRRSEDLMSRKILNQLESLYIHYSPASMRENSIYAESLKHLSALREHRRMRLYKATESHYYRLFGLLGLIGMGIVGISYLFGMENVWVQIILTGFLSAMIAAILSVMIFLNNPFLGYYLTVSPMAYEEFLYIVKSSAITAQ